MFWWIIAAYFAIAVVVFIGLVRNLQPLDGRAWLEVLLAALFWPVAAALWAFV